MLHGYFRKLPAERSGRDRFGVPGLPNRTGNPWLGGSDQKEIPMTDQDASVRGRGVVLGGGGVTGIAWEIGVVVGLGATGVD